MLTFATFLEHANAVMEREAARVPAWKAMPPLLESHIFWLGDDKEFYDHIIEIRNDLMPEMKERIHMPFSDTTTVSVIRKPGQPPIWTLDRVVEDPPYLLDLVDPASRKYSFGGPQRLLVVRYQAVEETPLHEDPVFTWVIGFSGVKDGSVYFDFTPSGDLAKLLDTETKIDQFTNESKIIMDVLAAISHPENYLVKVTPELTPKEERKVLAGRPRPPQKAKHFIVVDHTVLVRMRGDANVAGTHASPVPHERRGHWRRVAERCRHAKLMGKERVFVRPTIVGDATWKHEKNFYEVLPDKGVMLGV